MVHQCSSWYTLANNDWSWPRMFIMVEQKRLTKSYWTKPYYFIKMNGNDWLLTILHSGTLTIYNHGDPWCHHYDKLMVSSDAQLTVAPWQPRTALVASQGPIRMATSENNFCFEYCTIDLVISAKIEIMSMIQVAHTCTCSTSSGQLRM